MRRCCVVAVAECERSLNLRGHERRVERSLRGETMRHDINTHPRGRDELPRAVPTSARYTAALVAAMLGSSAALPVLSQGIEFVVVDIHAVADGYRASKLIGSNVVNDQNEKIGTIEDIIIGRDRVLFAVLQVGGFLHLGGHMV